MTFDDNFDDTISTLIKNYDLPAAELLSIQGVAMTGVSAYERLAMLDFLISNCFTFIVAFMTASVRTTK